MENKITLELRSRDAIAVHEVLIDKNKSRRILDAAIAKTARLYTMARDGNPYAYIALLEIKQAYMELQQYYKREQDKYEQVMNEKMNGQVPEITIPVSFKRQLGVSNNMIFSIIHSLISYDTLVCTLIKAKDIGVLSDKRAFFKLKNRFKQKLYKFYSGVVNIPAKFIPEITIEDYLNETAKYKKAMEQFKQIQPHVLFNAISLSSAPPVQTKDYNMIRCKLKELAASTSGEEVLT